MQSSALRVGRYRPLQNSLGSLTRPLEPRLEHCRRQQSQPAFSSRRNAGRQRAAPIAAEARDDERSTVPPIAGIPVSVDQSTAVGERLWTALQRHPHEFVPLVIVELQQVWLCEHYRRHEQLNKYLNDELHAVAGIICTNPQPAAAPQKPPAPQSLL